MAVVPLANVGWEFAGGDLLGFAAVLPRDADETTTAAMFQALRALLRSSNDEAWFLDLVMTSAWVWRLELTGSPSRASLQPSRWTRSARSWASVTPVVLDRFPDHGDDIETARIVAGMCRNIGLPEPTSIELHKHSIVRGAPPAYPARGDARRPDWSFPPESKLANRPRRHVVITFDVPVEGPVILGAGRYHGMGLCLPQRAGAEW
jgi:CRISPR-associated protein Csb2